MKLKDKAKIKVTSLLYTIYTKCEMGVPFVLPELISDLKLTSHTGPVIRQLKLFERIEKREEGYLYKWVKAAPNEKMIEDVIISIREYTRALAKRSKQKTKEIIVEQSNINFEKTNDQLVIPNLPPNTPGPLLAVCNLILQSMQQQNSYLKAMGDAVSDVQSKVDNLHTQLNN